METNLPEAVRTGGRCVCGGMNTDIWFIENWWEHADKIIRHIIR